MAPERFYTDIKKDNNSKLLAASDIFSFGCVVAEIFMDGQVLFDLSQLLKYKTHGFDEYDPTILLAKKVDDKYVRELIEHCINLEPNSRWTPQKYLDFYKEKIFPSYFDDLYELNKKFLNVNFSEADNKIKYLQKKYVDILKMVSCKNENEIDFNATAPEIFRKETNHKKKNKERSNSDMMSPKMVNNKVQQTEMQNIPKLELIMKQQKLQQLDNDSYVILYASVYLLAYLLFIDRQTMMSLCD